MKLQKESDQKKESEQKKERSKQKKEESGEENNESGVEKKESNEASGGESENSRESHEKESEKKKECERKIKENDKMKEIEVKERGKENYEVSCEDECEGRQKSGCAKESELEKVFLNNNNHNPDLHISILSSLQEIVDQSQGQVELEHGSKFSGKVLVSFLSWSW